MRLKLDTRCEVCASWYWCERRCGRTPTPEATVRLVAATLPVVQADEDVEVLEVEMAKDDDKDGKKLQFRVTAEELERIERARGAMPMSKFLRAAVLRIAEQVELLTEGA